MRVPRVRQEAHAAVQRALLALVPDERQVIDVTPLHRMDSTVNQPAHVREVVLEQARVGPWYDVGVVEQLHAAGR